jgi:hypothetical protein
MSMYAATYTQTSPLGRFPSVILLVLLALAIIGIVAHVAAA